MNDVLMITAFFVLCAVLNWLSPKIDVWLWARKHTKTTRRELP
jgi:hypothetical protein